MCTYGFIVGENAAGIAHPDSSQIKKNIEAYSTLQQNRTFHEKLSCLELEITLALWSAACLTTDTPRATFTDLKTKMKKIGLFSAPSNYGVIPYYILLAQIELKRSELSSLVSHFSLSV